MSRIEQLRNLLADEPDDVFLNFGLAMELVHAGQADEALAAFDAVIALDPNYTAAHVQKAHLLIKAGRREDARAVIDAGIASAKKAGDAHTVEKLEQLI